MPRSIAGELGVEFSLIADFRPPSCETLRKIVPRYAAALL